MALTTKQLSRYAGPMILSSIGGVVVGLTDTIIIGNYSTPALAGVALGASIYELPANALFGALMAFTILQPRFAGDPQTERSSAGLKLILCGIAPWAAIAFAVLATTSVLMILTSSSDQESSTFQGGVYLLARSPSVVLEVAISALTVTLVSWGLLKVPLIVFLVSSGVNLLLDLPLVYGLGPIPSLGAFGDGVASTIGLAVVVPWLAWKTRSLRRQAENAEIWPPARFDGWKRLTLPAVGSAALDYAGNIAFVTIIALAGTAGLAAARLASITHLLAFVVVASLSSAALYILGLSYDQDPGYVLRERRTVRFRFLSFASSLGVVIAALAWPIAFVSSPDPEVRSTATLLILVVAALCPLIGWTYANVTILRGIEKTGLDFISNVLAVWAAQVPLAAVGLVLFGAPGAFGGLIGYWVCRGAITQAQVASAVKGSDPVHAAKA